jgi:hypothetical protein
MKGPRELKRYVAIARDHLRAARFDDLKIFKSDRCKKWRKKHRRPRDGFLA